MTGEGEILVLDFSLGAKNFTAQLAVAVDEYDVLSVHVLDGSDRAFFVATVDGLLLCILSLLNSLLDHHSAWLPHTSLMSMHEDVCSLPY